MGSKNIFLFGINGLKIRAWWAWLQDTGFDSPFSSMELLSLPSKHKEVTFFYMQTFCFKIRVRPRKMKPSRENQIFVLHSKHYSKEIYKEN